MDTYAILDLILDLELEGDNTIQMLGRDVQANRGCAVMYK